MVHSSGVTSGPGRRRESFSVKDWTSGSNYATFLAHSAPGLPVRAACASSQLAYRLQDLWSSFDEASAFGVEVPIRFSPRLSDISEVKQCYVPYLSALQIFERDSRWLQSRCCDDGSDEDLYQESLCSDSHSISSIGSSYASEEDKSAPTPRSICDRHQPAACGKRLLFEFDETAPPHLREPLTDRVQRLAHETGCPELLTLRSDELHPHSWFAVAWYPLYQIPAGRCLKELSACFLTFHSMTLPPPLLHLRKTLPAQGMLPAIPANKAGSRAEAEALPPVPAPAIVAALAPQLQQRHISLALPLDGSSACCQRLWLPPFACIPYKAQAKAWLGNEAATCIHCNMIAAALTWNSYVGFKHSDLDFFAGRLQHAAGC